MDNPDKLATQDKTNTASVNKTLTLLLQTPGDDPNIAFMWKS